MLRAVVHAVLASSLVAGPPASGREYAGVDGVEVPEATETSGDADATVPEPPVAAPEATRPDAPTPVTSDAVAPADETAAPAEVEAPLDAPAEGPEEEEDGLSEAPYDPLIDSPEAIRARSWVRSGAVFMTVGLVLAIGGIAMSTATVNSLADQNVCMPRQDKAGNGCQEGARDRAAMALGLPGAVLLAGGIAMLAVGKVQQRRLRAGLRASRRDLMIGLQLAF